MIRWSDTLLKTRISSDNEDDSEEYSREDSQ